MRNLMLALAVVLMTGCTVMNGAVKDVSLQDGKLTMQKCDLKVYLAFYGLVSSETNCRTEVR